jgi:hypothetical protein
MLDVGANYIAQIPVQNKFGLTVLRNFRVTVVGYSRQGRIFHEILEVEEEFEMTNNCRSMVVFEADENKFYF